VATLARGPWHVAARVAASTLGAWALAWSFAAFGTAALARAGLSFPEASTLAMLLGLVLLLVACCWAIAARSLARVWAVLLVAGAAMTAAARLLATA
jgi:hypothetical protein